MDHERDARGMKRWAVIGAVAGGLLGLVLGIGGAVGGDGAASLWAGPAFACLGAGIFAMLRMRVAYTYSELGGLPGRDRRRLVGRTVGLGLALCAAGAGFLVLTGATELL